MNLVIDVGNTLAKAGIFEEDCLLDYYSSVDSSNLEKIIRSHQPQSAIIASVGRDIEDLRQIIELYSEFIVLNPDTPVPINNHYETPKTLGLDRVAGIVGAKAIHPDLSCLVIDLGTCITYDYIDGKDNYWGGGISPGLHMRFRSMHDYTAKLPLIQDLPQDLPELVGPSTHKAMLSGVIHGISSEIQGIMAAYQHNFGNFKTILSGGDAVFFETKIKEQIFVIEELTLIGLNRILRYNIHG